MICDLQTGEMEERILPDVDGFQVQEDGKLLTSGDRFGEKAEKIARDAAAREEKRKAKEKAKEAE